MAMKIKTGDRVQVIAGKEKGKSGKVIQVFPEDRRAVVEGLNVLTRHLRSQRRGEKGQKVSFSGPLEASNLMVVCGKCGRPTRVEIRIAEGGARIRTCKKCKESVI